MEKVSFKNNDFHFSEEPSKAVEELMDCYGSLVLRTAYFYVSDRYMAEDLSQEVFIRAFRNWTKFRGDASVKTWLMKITINLCRDYSRLKATKEIPTEDIAINSISQFNLEEEILKRISHTTILQYVLSLPVQYQEVLYLYYYSDLTTVEIAKVIGNPEGTVRGRLHRARKLLGQELSKEGLEQ